MLHVAARAAAISVLPGYVYASCLAPTCGFDLPYSMAVCTVPKATLKK